MLTGVRKYRKGGRKLKPKAKPIETPYPPPDIPGWLFWLKVNRPKIKPNKKVLFARPDTCKNSKPKEFKVGFTLIEIIIVMGIIALLAAVVIVAINPARQFAQARNSQRLSNVNSILNAVGQNIADNRGVFNCPAGPLPTSVTTIKSSGGYDIVNCLVPVYLPSLPFDPSAPGAHFTSATDYDTAYTIFQDATTGRLTVEAPFAKNPSELDIEVSATR